MNDGKTAGKRWSSIFDNKSFLLLWTGNATSSIGSDAVLVAYPLVTLMLTGSPILAGCARFAMTLPHVLFGISAGIVADLRDRRRVLLACQRIGLMATLVASAAIVFRVPGVWIIVFLAAAFAEGTAQAFFGVSEMAFVRNIVDEQQRPAAYALFDVEVRLAGMMGRTFTGISVGVARNLPFLANAVSYMYSLWTLRAIRGRVPTQANAHGSDRARPSGWNHPAAGLRLLSTEPFLFAIAVVLAIMSAVSEIAQLQITLEVRNAGEPPTTIGLVLAAFGLGGICGALPATWLTRRFNVVSLLTWGLGAWGVLLVPLALRVSPLQLAVCWAGIGAVTAVSSVAAHLCFIRLIPDYLFGRTEGAIGFVIVVGAAVGALLSGIVLTTFGTSTTGWMLVIGMALLAICTHRLREPRAVAMQPPEAGRSKSWIDKIPALAIGQLDRFTPVAEKWITKVADLAGDWIDKFTDGGRHRDGPNPTAGTPVGKDAEPRKPA